MAKAGDAHQRTAGCTSSLPSLVIKPAGVSVFTTSRGLKKCLKAATV
eukprot:CAMPEP_0195528720 /NCGR_PEP_ID=MMETSP0794_2-20130614/31002_1 /TAXON_ID=515487 /ORGANISM="Stephanopyxis turris, Strain CCMP 815" /LENGTH=46 /DNA_ID= /DNA_START= /DNA_END= /DNA_ORIENTATION=